MAAPERPARPQAVLFACGMNAVRSPMAAGLFQQLFCKTIYVGSAGVQNDRPVVKTLQASRPSA